MNLANKISVLILTAVFGLAAAAIAFGGSASADCYQYNANGFTTSATPVFNNICGVPEGINDESNFVRIRQDSNGNDEDNDNNPAYSVGTLTSACSAGDKFDVWNYLHNNASTAYNPDTNPSDPSAVAQDVKEDLTATFGTNSKFTFGDTVTASNAATVSDSAMLDCGGNQVQLSLVPGSVHIYSIPYGGWENLSDGTVNGGPFAVGSTNTGGEGSGTMWGCWNYRIVIVYQVETSTVPKTTPPTCNLLELENDNGVARIDNVEYTANSATVTGFKISINNGSSTVTKQLTLNQFPFTYQMKSGITYNFTATVLSNLGNVTSSKCQGQLTTTTPPTPTPTPSTPPSTPTTTTSSSQLVNTGPGSVVAIFAGASVLGTALYHFVLRKRLAKH